MLNVDLHVLVSFFCRLLYLRVILFLSILLYTALYRKITQNPSLELNSMTKYLNSGNTTTVHYLVAAFIKPLKFDPLLMVTLVRNRTSVIEYNHLEHLLHVAAVILITCKARYSRAHIMEFRFLYSPQTSNVSLRTV